MPMFMQCICNLDLINAIRYLFSMYAIHYYQCLFLIRPFGAREFDNKFLLNQSINKNCIQDSPKSTLIQCKNVNCLVLGYLQHKKHKKQNLYYTNLAEIKNQETRGKNNNKEHFTLERNY